MQTQTQTDVLAAASAISNRKFDRLLSGSARRLVGVQSSLQARAARVGCGCGCEGGAELAAGGYLRVVCYAVVLLCTTVHIMYFIVLYCESMLVYSVPHCDSIP